MILELKFFFFQVSILFLESGSALQRMRTHNTALDRVRYSVCLYNMDMKYCIEVRYSSMWGLMHEKIVPVSRGCRLKR